MKPFVATSETHDPKNVVVHALSAEHAAMRAKTEYKWPSDTTAMPLDEYRFPKGQA